MFVNIKNDSQLLAKFDRNPKSLTREQLLAVADIYEGKSKGAKGDLSGQITFSAYVNGAKSVCIYMFKAAKAAVMAGDKGRSRRLLMSASRFAELSADKIIEYSKKTKDTSQTRSLNEASCSFLQKAAKYSQFAHNQSEYNRLSRREAIEKNRGTLISLAKEIGHARSNSERASLLEASRRIINANHQLGGLIRS